MTPLQAAATLVQLEEKSIPEWYVVVVGYLTEDGHQAYKYHIAGDFQISTAHWALSSINHKIITAE